MIDYRTVGTKITDVPSFIVTDCRICDAYMIAKGEMSPISILPRGADILELIVENWRELSLLCGLDFMQKMAELEDAESKPQTILFYGIFMWCVKMSVKIRISERMGRVQILNAGYVPGNRTLH